MSFMVYIYIPVLELILMYFKCFLQHTKLYFLSHTRAHELIIKGNDEYLRNELLLHVHLRIAVGVDLVVRVGNASRSALCHRDDLQIPLAWLG